MTETETEKESEEASKDSRDPKDSKDSRDDNEDWDETISILEDDSRDRCSMCEATVSEEDRVIVALDVKPDKESSDTLDSYFDDEEKSYTMEDDDVLCENCAESIFGYEKGATEGRIARLKTAVNQSSSEEIMDDITGIIITFIVFFFITLWIIL